MSFAYQKAGNIVEQKQNITGKENESQKSNEAGEEKNMLVWNKMEIGFED